MAVSQSTRPRIVRRDGNVLHIVIPKKPTFGEWFADEVLRLDADELIELAADLRSNKIMRTPVALRFIDFIEQRARGLTDDVLPLPHRPTESPAKLDQYRQDIWDSFPHLCKPAPMLTVHPYFETQE